MEQGADYPVAEAVRSSLGVWIFVVPPPDSAHIASLRREYRLDLGESEAILVAEVLGNTPPPDGRATRRAVRARGFRLSDQHYEQILGELGE